ncbi:hypothetical protein T05_8263 [Trichinella murrelli]|uniref:Uncharacterized protein n=1 Tax=Trichinella murrelli TaxID=144512 RepID=A0A0V0TB20_9BILA|nr:hypothetical protein T05_8263 [Trichinella murrelli]
MKTLFTLFSLAFLAVIVQGGEESGKKVEPLPCKDRGSKASCNRYMKKDNFEELCKENRRIGRYLCCKTCAEKLGVEVNEDGKFKVHFALIKDFGTFTYYEPTCPALEDRASVKMSTPVGCFGVSLTNDYATSHVQASVH